MGGHMSEYKFSFLRSLLTVGMNLMLLASLFVAMYRASLTPENFNITFFKTVFSLIAVILTLFLGGRRLLNRYRPPEP